MWIINRATDCKQRYQLWKYGSHGKTSAFSVSLPEMHLQREIKRKARSEMANTEQHDHLGNFCFCSGVSVCLCFFSLLLFVYVRSSCSFSQWLVFLWENERWKTEIMWRQKQQQQQQHHHDYHHININSLPLCEKDEKHMSTRKREKCVQLH